MIEGENGGRVHGEDLFNASEERTHSKTICAPYVHGIDTRRGSNETRRLAQR